MMKKILAKKLASVLSAYSHTAFAHCSPRLSVLYCAQDRRTRTLFLERARAIPSCGGRGRLCEYLLV